MNDNDRALLDRLLRSIPTDVAEIDFGALSNVGRVAIALVGEPAVALEWWRTNEHGDRDRLDEMIVLTVDEPAVGTMIDEAIERGDAGIVEDLVRTGVPWSHPALPNLLGDDAGRLPAAWLLTETGDGAVSEALNANRIELKDAIDLLRPGAILGVAEFFDAAADIADGLEPGDASSRLDALMCGIDPERFVRRVVQGRSTWSWLGHGVSVADVIHALGASTWLDTLAILEGTKAWDAFEFASSLALAGAGVATTNRASELSDEELETLEEILLDPSTAEAAVSDPAFGLATSLADDEDLQALFVECAAHELLTRSGEGSPGLAGLPLSGGTAHPEAVEAALDFFEEVAAGELSDDMAVGAVRTLCDLAYWSIADPSAVVALEPVVQRLRTHEHASVKVAAEQAHVARTGASPEAHGPVADFVGLLAKDRSEAPGGEGCLGLAAIERLAAIGDEASLESLVEIWTTGPLVRSDAARLGLLDVLTVLATESD